MKKAKLVSLLFLVVFAFNTKIIAQTTQEEYNYITKGYKVQVESGLDMKKGYTLKDLGNWGLNYGNENRECIFKSLIRQGQTKPCAIMMIYRRTDIANGANYYICIPSPASDDSIWQQTLGFINSTIKGNDSMLQTVIWALMKFTSQEASK